MPAGHPPSVALDRQYLRDVFDVMLLQQAASRERVLVDLFFEIPAERRPVFEPRSVRVKSNRKLAAPGAEPIREPQKILLVNRIEHFHHRTLDDLVLQRRNP
jgi:hypothetical protein